MGRLRIVNSFEFDATVELRHVEPPRVTEQRDVRTFRSPFGQTIHRLGTGKQFPSLLQVRGTLAADDMEDGLDQLERLDAVLLAVTQVEYLWETPFRFTTIPVKSAAGSRVAVPLLTGWRVTAWFLIDPAQEWSSTEGPSVHFTADADWFTADNDAVTVDIVF